MVRRDTTVGQSIDITVLIPFRGACPYLKDCLDSIDWSVVSGRLQTVLVDDGAEPSSRALAERWRQGRPDTCIVNSGGEGLAGALEAGLEHAKGRYIARLDADDVAAPARFDAQAAFLTSHAGAVCVGSQIRLMDAAGSPTGTSQYPTSPSEIRRALEWDCPIAHPASMMLTDAVRAVGGYRTLFRNETTSLAEDYDLWIRLARLGDIYNLPQPLTYYRQHGGQLTAQSRFEVAMATLGVRLVAELEVRQRQVPTTPIQVADFIAASKDRRRRRRSVAGLPRRFRREYEYRILVTMYRHQQGHRLGMGSHPLSSLLLYPEQTAREHQRFVRARRLARRGAPG